MYQYSKYWLSLFYESNVGYSYLDLNLILKNQSLYRPEDISIILIYENNLINHDNKNSPISVGISSQIFPTFSSEEFDITIIFNKKDLLNN